MAHTQELTNRLHQLIEQHENRGLIGALAASGKLCRPLRAAADSIVQDRGGRVAIVTGFFVPDAEEPRAETDGPIGAAQLAHFLESGGWDVTVITDAHCRAVSTRCRELVGGDYRISVVSGDGSIEEICAFWSSGAQIPGHLIAIERAGPNARGEVTNIAGRNITDVTAPLHLLFHQARKQNSKTISLADGSNEIGSGNIREAIASVSQDFDVEKFCEVEVDYLVLGYTANICATALASAMAIADPKLASHLINSFDADLTNYMLECLASEQVAVDGLLRKFSRDTVDGFHSDLFNETTHSLIRTAATRSVLHSVE